MGIEQALLTQGIQPCLAHEPFQEAVAKRTEENPLAISASVQAATIGIKGVGGSVQGNLRRRKPRERSHGSEHGVK